MGEWGNGGMGGWGDGGWERVGEISGEGIEEGEQEKSGVVAKKADEVMTLMFCETMVFPGERKKWFEQWALRYTAFQRPGLKTPQLAAKTMDVL